MIKKYYYYYIIIIKYKEMKKLFIKYYLYVNNYTMINKHLFSANYF